MFNVMIDEETKKVIGFHPTNHVLVKVEMDALPQAEQKVGIEHVQYYNPETEKIELREEERELTDKEKIMKKMEEFEANQLATMEALAEMKEEQEGGV